MAEVDIGKVKLRRVRLSFPHILEPQPGRPDKATGKTAEPRYNASFLIPKNGDEIQKDNLKKLKAAKEAVMAAKWPPKPGKPAFKLKAEKLCTRDGDEENREEYKDHYYVASGTSVDRPPEVIDSRKDAEGQWVRLVGEKNGERGWINGGAAKMYAGCYVNAIVRLWAQDNDYGQRVNATLEIVQFYGHGDAFGAQRANAEDEFGDDDVGDVEEIDGEDEADDGSDLI